MGKTTEYLGLYEPYDSDFYDVDRDQNENLTILDSKAKEVDETIKGLGSNKQDKQDNSLNTTDKTVPGAINELNKGKWGKFETSVLLNDVRDLQIVTGEISTKINVTRVVFPHAFKNECLAVLPYDIVASEKIWNFGVGEDVSDIGFTLYTDKAYAGLVGYVAIGY